MVIMMITWTRRIMRGVKRSRRRGAWRRVEGREERGENVREKRKKNRKEKT